MRGTTQQHNRLTTETTVTAITTETTGTTETTETTGTTETTETTGTTETTDTGQLATYMMRVTHFQIKTEAKHILMLAINTLCGRKKIRISRQTIAPQADRCHV